MNIVATKLPLIEEIVEKFLKRGKENILDQLSDLLETIDELCSKRPKSLKFVKYKQRTILTDFGLLTFKRRYYFDTLKCEYLYLLDYKLKIVFFMSVGIMLVIVPLVRRVIAKDKQEVINNYIDLPPADRN